MKLRRSKKGEGLLSVRHTQMHHAWMHGQVHADLFNL